MFLLTDSLMESVYRLDLIEFIVVLKIISIVLRMVIIFFDENKEI